MKTMNETKVVCPKCGAQFAIAEQTHVATGVVIGKDAGLGTIHPEVVGQEEQAPVVPVKAIDRIEALRKAGVDVSCFFAMSGANGGEFVGKDENGKITMLADDDPIFDCIRQQGDVYNPKLARRWVMAQMFHMLAAEKGKYYHYYKDNSITDQIRRKGYDYMWKQLEDELHAQYKMKQHEDDVNFRDRNRWFDKELVVAMLEDYRYQLHLHVKNGVKVRKCKGVPYKRICGEDVFVDDIQKKVFAPIEKLKEDVLACDNAGKLFWKVHFFNRDMRKQRGWKPKQCAAWIDAYKGAGAFFTMQNMVRYHGCRFAGLYGKTLDKTESYRMLEGYAAKYDGEGWRMIGVLRKFLQDNNIDINKKMAEWRKRK